MSTAAREIKFTIARLHDAPRFGQICRHIPSSPSPTGCNHANQAPQSLKPIHLQYDSASPHLIGRQLLRLAPDRPKDFDAWTDEVRAEYADQFRMQPGETLAGVLAEYDRVASRTDELVASLPDLEHSWPLPPAPWFEPGARRSARRVLLHIIAETAQRAGHADIIRESLDGAKTMG